MAIDQGARLRRFRERNGISIREAARQLHVKHPALMQWEAGRVVPLAVFRQAIEVWTNGEIAADRWPLTVRELELTAQAARVVPAVAGNRAAG